MIGLINEYSDTKTKATEKQKCQKNVKEVSIIVKSHKIAVCLQGL